MESGTIQGLEQQRERTGRERLFAENILSMFFQHEKVVVSATRNFSDAEAVVIYKKYRL